MLLDPSPSLAALLAALAWDRLLGEPPARVHPVVWIGAAIARARGLAAPGRPLVELAVGATLALLLPAAVAALGVLVLAALEPLPLVRFAVEAYLLKSTFALRALGEAAEEVRRPLVAGDLEAARRALRSLCSRDPSTLDAELVAAAAVESVAENASDSFVAPLFWYGVLGLPGALFYRAVNTLDAMIGYRGRFEHLGKASARLDDLLNLLPARLTALLLLAAGWWHGCDVRHAAAIRARDARLTASPNAGHPMAAMAGLLGVVLEKPGAYRLGDARRAVTPVAIDEAWRLTTTAAAAMVLLVLSDVLLDAVLAS
jgi:adenosylcobinamide-phosphate synthase